MQSGYERVLAKIGGRQWDLVELTGCPQSTVAYWARTGNIPVARIPGIIRRAKKMGIELEPADFMPWIEAAQ